MVLHDKVYDVTSFVDEHPYVPPVAIATSIHPLFLCGRHATGCFSHRESLPLIAKPTGQLGLSGPQRASHISIISIPCHTRPQA
jgi:hypothetical protein